MEFFRIVAAILSAPMLSLVIAFATQSSLEEKPYKVSATAGASRSVYRAPLLVPHIEVKLPTRPDLETGGQESSGARGIVKVVQPQQAARGFRAQSGTEVPRNSASKKRAERKKEEGDPCTVAPGSKKPGEKIASWYGKYFHGRPMANTKPFNMHDPTTVAHKKLPLGTRIRATNVCNGRSIVAVVRDRGPYIAGRDLDFSRAAAERLGFVNAGLARIHMEVL